ncbi:MAG: hypothetical protein ACFFAN_12095 [Promethearchaeota archaeon]
MKSRKPILKFMKKFIDFDKQEKIFYCNYYLSDYKIVLKTPLVNNGGEKDNIDIDKFNLTKFIYLIHFD